MSGITIGERALKAICEKALKAVDGDQAGGPAALGDSDDGHTVGLRCFLRPLGGGATELWQQT